MPESLEKGPKKKRGLTRRDVIRGGALLMIASTLTRDARSPDATVKVPTEGKGIEKKKDAFERKFYARKQIPVGNTTVEIADVSPETPNDKTPILINPGWGITIDMLKAGMRKLSGTRRTLCVNHLRYGGDTNLAENEKKLLKDIPPEEIRRALTVAAIVKHEGLHALNVSGTSEDAISTVAAALLLDERAKKEGREHGEIRNVILANPIGFIGRDTFSRLAGGQIRQNLQTHPDSLNAGSEWPGDRKVTPEMRQRAAAEGRTIPEYAAITETEESAEGVARALKDIGLNAIKNPIRSYNEIAGMVQAQIVHLLRELKARNIGVVIMTAVDDPVVLTERLTKTVSSIKSPEENTRADIPANTKQWEEAWTRDITNIAEKLVDGVLTVRGNHGHPLHPDFLAAQETVFTSLEAKQAKKLR